MYLDFRPGGSPGSGSITGVDGKYENKILNLWDYASRGSTTITDSRIVAVGQFNKWLSNPGKLDYPYDYGSPTIWRKLVVARNKKK